MQISCEICSFKELKFLSAGVVGPMNVGLQERSSRVRLPAKFGEVMKGRNCRKCGGSPITRRCADTFYCQHCGMQPGNTGWDRAGFPPPDPEFDAAETEGMRE